MKKCKYCGKEFESTPVYCIRCGASDDFLIQKMDKVTNNIYNKESKIKNYDELAKEFLGDEYTKNDKWAIPKYKLNQIENEQDYEYYSFLKEKLGNEPLNNRNKNEYYNALENISKDPLCSIEETTFNGIFDKEDTIENTFFKSKEKNITGISNKSMKSKKKKWFRGHKKDSYDSLDNAIMKITSKTKKNKKIRKKLGKMIFGLIALLSLLLVIMFTLINNIVNVNDIEAPLPTEAVALSLFSEIKNTDEVNFMKNPKCLYIPNDINIRKNTNKFYLKALFDLVNGENYEIKSVKKIEAKGALRAVVTYEVTGEILPVKVFESLIFRDIGNNNFKLDFEEFILRYNRFNSIDKVNNI